MVSLESITVALDSLGKYISLVPLLPQFLLLRKLLLQFLLPDKTLIVAPASLKNYYILQFRSPQKTTYYCSCGLLKKTIAVVSVSLQNYCCSSFFLRNYCCSSFFLRNYVILQLSLHSKTIKYCSYGPLRKLLLQFLSP